MSKDYYCEECRSYEQRIEQCEYQIRETLGPLIREYAAATFNMVLQVRTKEKEIHRSLSAIRNAFAKHVKETHATSNAVR